MRRTDDSGKLKSYIGVPCDFQTNSRLVDTAVHSNLSKQKKKPEKHSPDLPSTPSDNAQDACGNGEMTSTESPIPSSEFLAMPPLSPVTQAVAEDQSSRATPMLNVTDATVDDPKISREAESVDRMAKILARQWYWRGIAFASFVVGLSLIHN